MTPKQAVPVTTDDVLDAIRAAFAAAPDPEGAATVTEMVESTGFRDPSKVRNGVRKLLAAGKMEVVKVQRARLDGALTTVSAYRLKG